LVYKVITDSYTHKERVLKTNITEGTKLIPKKLSRLISFTRKIRRIQKKVDDLAESIAIDISKGLSTGDKVQDFALLSCHGEYNPAALERYKEISNLGKRHTNQRILVIQKAESLWGDDTFIIKNIYLAQIRDDETIFDKESMSIHLPVHPGYLLYRESIEDDELSWTSEKINNPWLITGLLRVDFSDYVYATGDDESFAYVPLDSSCDIELLPPKHKDDLLERYGIDNHQLNLLQDLWRRYNIS
jgi:hypothetical protein